MSSILVENVLESKPLILLKLNIKHLDSPDFRVLIHSVWNLAPRPCGERGWLL